MRLYKGDRCPNIPAEGAFCNDAFYESLAAEIIHSGVVSGDVEFLQSGWCQRLLGFLDCSMTGMEILEKYQAWQKLQEGGVNRGKR